MPPSRQSEKTIPIEGTPSGHASEGRPAGVRAVQPAPSFWQSYTPRNIVHEIRWRLSTLSGRRNKSNANSPPQMSAERHASSVGEFYDLHHADFLQVYGEVIQALRTKDIVDLLNYQINSIGFLPGQRVLDAGCGIGVPGIHFARNAQVQVDAITISRLQYEAAR